MIDYAFKAHVLNNHPDVVRFHRKWSLQHYRANVDPDHVVPDEVLDDLVADIHKDEYGRNVWREAERINNAYYARVKRLKDRIRNMLSMGTCYFLTLTFNDDTLNRTCEQTRRKYVTWFLKSFANVYIANIDYGSVNGREHYHAVVLHHDPWMHLWDIYGFSNAKKYPF